MPSQIDTTGLTHLILSYATMDPKTFEVRPMHPDDEEVYKQFLALPPSVAKWIGIGGWEFNDPGSTNYTWSLMSSSKENRKTFVESLRKFLAKWNFRGVNIDWEWPGHSARGGNSADKQNHVTLMTELRQALGSDFGLSTVLPAQYEYLQHMDPKSLEAQVDFLSIVTHDLHGAWDAYIPGLGPYIKPHTDLKEIEEALKLLWSADVTPKKINLGVANYGRGFTVSNKDCMIYGCQYTGPSNAGSCTNLEGLLSACEIKRIIAANNLSPNILYGGAGVKEIRWNDQWVAYDDKETFDLKLELATNRCLGGTALWAIDYEICDGRQVQPNPSPQPSSQASSSGAVIPTTTSSAQGSLLLSTSSSTAVESSATTSGALSSTAVQSSSAAATSASQSTSGSEPQSTSLGGSYTATISSAASFFSSSTIWSDSTPSSDSSAQSSNVPTSTPWASSYSSTFTTVSTAAPSATRISETESLGGTKTQVSVTPSDASRKPCPWECWKEEWCKMFFATTSGGVHNDGDPDSHSDSDHGCVPNNCIADCIMWRITTLLLFKRPVCPCIPRKCDQDSDSDSPSDSDKDDPHPHPRPKPSTKPHDKDPDNDSKDKDDHPENGGDGECQMLGCGCGWMGLGFGPGCADTTITWELPKFGFTCGLFGCKPCNFFGCTEPGTDPNGILGYNGYCLVDGGCPPCPPEICSGPSCTISGGCGPKPGPPPTQPANRPKSCDEWQKTTVTERFVWCTEGFAVSELPSSIGLTSSTMISSVCVPYIEATLKACPGALLGYTTTTTKTEKSTLTSEAPACTRAPLSLDDDEGDNMPADGSLSSSIVFRSNASKSSMTTPSMITTSSTTSSTTSTQEPATTSATMDRYGNWRVNFHHWMEPEQSGIEWVLYDPNGNQAGAGGVQGKDFKEITDYIESKNRIEEHSMLFGVRVTVTDPTNVDKARVKFVIEKEVPGCHKCKPMMITEDKTEIHPFEVRSCQEVCQEPKLRPANFWCNDLNDAMWIPENGGWKRRFWCGWVGF
ncbi:glycoside hydrolase family 18 protein [Cucurbitaria berberidis CBS 394.84]|uniref:chitinase n=1 Tax=Cucurbitaria berberidis CBS 394.84 TaxID=1168544 RepID=A0A9P4GFB2_9PLEO|nr:glycoside hydrolase family 18 protein [Cucurbitaria berberidis CBS 394.84]KAF1844426.1 glycoside hydrolase family 18 protein [Cucurbitaria berberidis CBS 394.84]